MSDFYSTFLVTFLIALLTLIITIFSNALCPGKELTLKSLPKIAAVILIILIITLLVSYIQYLEPTLPVGIDEESTNIKVAWNNGGVALYRQENYTGAISYYDKAIEIDPEYVLALSNRGEALKALHRDDEAKRAFAKAREKI